MSAGRGIQLCWVGSFYFSLKMLAEVNAGAAGRQRDSKTVPYQQAKHGHSPFCSVVHLILAELFTSKSKLHNYYHIKIKQIVFFTGEQPKLCP